MTTQKQVNKVLTVIKEAFQREKNVECLTNKTNPDIIDKNTTVFVFNKCTALIFSKDKDVLNPFQEIHLSFKGAKNQLQQYEFDFSDDVAGAFKLKKNHMQQINFNTFVHNLKKSLDGRNVVKIA